MIEDTELLRRYAEDGAEDAFAEVVRRHIDVVYAVARRKVGGDAHLAEDVAQRVFADLARKAARVCRHRVPGAWLFTSTHYAATQLVRAERRRRAREEKAQAMNEILRDHASEPAIDWERLRPQIDDLVGELGDREREAVLLRFFEGRGFSEIGARLRLSEDGARSRVERAVEKLRGKLARRGVTSTTAALALALGHQVGAAAPAGLAAAITGPALAAAGSAAGATAGATLATFMSTTKITMGVTGVLVALAIAFAVRERTRARETAAELATVAQERAALRARLEALENAAVAAAVSPTRTTEAKPAARAKTAAAVAVPASGSGDADAIPEAELDRFVAANPELQKLYAQQIIMRRRSQYGPFYAAARLTAEQIAGFEKVMADHDHALLDVTTAAVAQGLEKNDPALNRLREGPGAERKRALLALLGDENFTQLAAYDRTRRMREFAKDLAGELFYTDTPLTARQGDEFTRIVAEANAEGRGPETWTRIVNRAREQGVLSPAQLAVLNERKEQVALGLRIQEMLEPLRARLRAPSK